MIEHTLRKLKLNLAGVWNKVCFCRPQRWCARSVRAICGSKQSIYSSHDIGNICQGLFSPVHNQWMMPHLTWSQNICQAWPIIEDLVRPVRNSETPTPSCELQEKMWKTLWMQANHGQFIPSFCQKNYKECGAYHRSKQWNPSIWCRCQVLLFPSQLQCLFSSHSCLLCFMLFSTVHVWRLR